MADDKWALDPKDVERRKKQLLADASGAPKSDGPNPMMGLGLQFVVTILVCLFVGQWLDRKMGTTPWFLLVGVLGGAGLGFWTMLRVSRGER